MIDISHKFYKVQVDHAKYGVIHAIVDDHDKVVIYRWIGDYMGDFNADLTDAILKIFGIWMGYSCLTVHTDLVWNTFIPTHPSYIDPEEFEL